MAFKTVTVRPTDGGQLLTRLEAAPVPIEHYRIKRNFRRESGRERRREGSVLFQPKAGDVGGQPYPNQIDGETITLITSFTSPAGRTATVAATATRIYRFVALDDLDIYYTAQPDWDTDLDAADYPAYFQSIPSAGDLITYGAAAEDSDPDNYPVYSAGDAGEWLLIGSGFSAEGHRWESEDISGTLILNNGYDLPVSIRANEFSVTPLYELRDQGIAYVDSIGGYLGMLMCIGVAEIQSDYLPAIRTASNYDPFVDEAKINRYQYRIINSPIGYPTRFGPNLKASVTAGSTTVELDYPANFIDPGDEIILTNAGEAGGNLTTTVINMSTDRKIVHLVDAIITTVNPSAVFRSDTLSFGPQPGYYDLKNDGSAALRGLEYSGRFVVLKSNGIAVLKYTADATNPFTTLFSYTDPDGSRSLYYRWTAWVDRAGYIGYASRNRIYKYDFTNRAPQVHPVIDQSADVLFDAAETALEDEIFAAVNAITDEVWLCFPSAGTDKGLIYSMAEPSCSTIDEEVTAAATITKPVEELIHGAAEEWFVTTTKIPQPTTLLGSTDLTMSITFDGHTDVITNDGHIEFVTETVVASFVMNNLTGETITFYDLTGTPFFVDTSYGTGFTFPDVPGGSIGASSSSGTFSPLTVTDATVFSRFYIIYTVGADPTLRRFYGHFGGPVSALNRYAKSNKPDFTGSVKALFTHNGVQYDSVLKGGFSDFGTELDEKMLRGYVPRVSKASKAVDSEIQIFNAERASDDEVIVLTETIQASMIPMLFLAHNISDQITVTGTADFELFARTFDVDVAQTQGINKV